MAGIRAWLPLLFLLSSLPSPAAPGDPRLHQVEGLSFLLPEEWVLEQPLEQPSADVAFVASGGPAGRIAVSRLPRAEAIPKLLPPNLDPLLAPEFAAERIRLHESGLVPTAATAASANENGTPVHSTAFRCRTPDGRGVVVLITTWHTPTKGVRARLQFLESFTPAMGSELDAIRASLRFQGAPTLGFGSFKLAGGPPLKNAATWTTLSNVPAPATQQVATATLPPQESPSARPVDPSESNGQLVQQFRASLIFVEGGGGSGSGFVCRTKDGDFLLTNQHVVAAMPSFRFTRLDRTPIPTGAMAAAIGHDIMRFAIQTADAPLQAMENVETGATIGDEIVVLGNTEGARVIQPLPGRLIGIGPDRVEVSAEFLPGNSGSPIIHVKSGKVLGIATYLMTSKFSEFTSAEKKSVRRFGYRIDSVKEWQGVHWPTFQAERAAMDKVEALTVDLIGLIREMSGKTQPNSTVYTNPALARTIRELDTTLGRRQLSVPDRQRAVQSFFANIRSMSQGDVNQARQTMRYSYFQEGLNEQVQVREEIYKLFDKLIKARR